MMRKIFLLSLSILGFSLNSFSSEDNYPNDSLKNEIAVSQDRLGYYNCTIKYSRKVSSDLWLSAGIVANGDYRSFEPKNQTSIFTTTNLQYLVGLIVGIDKHSNSALKGLEFVYGARLKFSYYNNTEHTDNPTLPLKMRTDKFHTYSAGVGCALGLYYNISDRFALGSELNPYIAYSESSDNQEPDIIRRACELRLFDNITIISLRFRW